MIMEFDFDKIFYFPVRAMKINRSHPDIKRNAGCVLHIILGHLLYGIVFVLVMYNLIFQNLKNKDFNEFCKNGVLSIVFGVVSFQLSITLWKRELLQELIDIIKKDYTTAHNLPREDQEIVKKYITKGIVVCKEWWIISCLACGVFFVKNLFLLAYYWAKGSPRLIHVYDLIYPGVIEEYKDNIFVYMAIYVILLYYGMYSMCTYTAFVPLGPSFMLHACGQLELVERRINNLYKGDHEVSEELKTIVKQLQNIYSFVELINSFVKEAYDLTFKGTAILLPVTLYEVLESAKNGELPLEFITFVVGGILISSTPCFNGELLMEKGENVRLALYSCGWESSYDPRERSTILIILLRAVRPTAICTHFCMVSLETLSEIFKLTYTIFSMMTAMMN